MRAEQDPEIPTPSCGQQINFGLYWADSRCVTMLVQTGPSWIRSLVVKPQVFTHHHMRAEAPQTPSMSPTGRPGCCFHLTDSPEDNSSVLYHLKREMEKENVHSLTHQRLWQQAESVYRTDHDPLCVSERKKVNSGEKYHIKSPLGYYRWNTMSVSSPLCCWIIMSQGGTQINR